MTRAQAPDALVHTNHLTSLVSSPAGSVLPLVVRADGLQPVNLGCGLLAKQPAGHFNYMRKVGTPIRGPHLNNDRSALRLEGFLLLGRELGDADARGRPHEGEEDGDPVGDRPGQVGQGGDAQGAGHVGARRRPR